jgi:hypothetical protein
MAAWSCEIAITMPQTIPATTSTTAALKLKDEALIAHLPVRRDWQGHNITAPMLEVNVASTPARSLAPRSHLVLTRSADDGAEVP